MDFSIIAVIFLIFSVVNSIFSGQKQKSQKSKNGKYSQIPSVFKSVTNKIQTELELNQEVEEMSLEDISELDCLNLVKVNNPEEEIQAETVTQDIFMKYEDTEEIEYTIEDEFDFHDIQKSIVLAEILGPPRVLKRNIR